MDAAVLCCCQLWSTGAHMLCERTSINPGEHNPANPDLGNKVVILILERFVFLDSGSSD